MKRRAVTPGITHATPLATSEVPATAIVMELAAIASLMTMTPWGGAIASAVPAGMVMPVTAAAGDRRTTFKFVMAIAPLLPIAVAAPACTQSVIQDP